MIGPRRVTVSLDGETIMVHLTVADSARAETARRQRLTAVCRLAASVLEARARALAMSLDHPPSRTSPNRYRALVDNAAVPVGEDKELTRALLRLLAAAFCLNPKSREPSAYGGDCPAIVTWPEARRRLPVHVQSGSSPRSQGAAAAPGRGGLQFLRAGFSVASILRLDLPALAVPFSRDQLGM